MTRIHCQNSTLFLPLSLSLVLFRRHCPPLPYVRLLVVEMIVRLIGVGVRRMRLTVADDRNHSLIVADGEQIDYEGETSNYPRKANKNQEK